MVGPFLLLAASVASAHQPAMAGLHSIAGFRPSTDVTARASATVRILPAIRFGPNHSGKAVGGERRRAIAPDSGLPLELLEFQ